VDVVSIYENANGNENRQGYYYGGEITLSFTVLKDDIFFIRLENRELCGC